MNAIERIQGFACEVTQEQWEELVRVADSVGVKVGGWSKSTGFKNVRYARIIGGQLCHRNHTMEFELIPYPDFLSKLKGEEKWEPKNGEEVEALDSGYWLTAKFIGMNGCRYGCIDSSDNEYINAIDVRPLRPTITRQEAEAILNKRIID